MPRNLVRIQKCGVFHFITFSCYRREPLLAERSGYLSFEETLEHVRRQFEFVVAGYVIMPEHVHLLVNEPAAGCLATALQVLKQITSRALKRPGDAHFWPSRYYDFNVWTERKQIEKLRYLHRNPVRRGLVANPIDWIWSSFAHYATGMVGPVEIESQWTANHRERLLATGEAISHPCRDEAASRMGHPISRDL